MRKFQSETHSAVNHLCGNSPQVVWCHKKGEKFEKNLTGVSPTLWLTFGFILYTFHFYFNGIERRKEKAEFKNAWPRLFSSERKITLAKLEEKLVGECMPKWVICLWIAEFGTNKKVAHSSPWERIMHRGFYLVCVSVPFTLFLRFRVYSGLQEGTKRLAGNSFYFCGKTLNLKPFLTRSCLRHETTIA